uniref:Uncharacterized protein n=1 Tax=Arundo donax TaxID=35708 RepID=A0A0A9CC71_ARUDO
MDGTGTALCACSSMRAGSIFMDEWRWQRTWG